MARAFALYADVTGDEEFMRERAWPVLSGVAEWITSRAIKAKKGYEVRASMGIAEREEPVANAAFTNMACVVVLKDAIAASDRLDRPIDPKWREIADGMLLPRREKAIVSHDGYRRDEEKGATPDPLMGIRPFGYPVAEDEEAATLALYLGTVRSVCGEPHVVGFVWRLGGQGRR